MKTNQTLAATVLVNEQVGRVTPCAPRFNNAEPARRGLARPASPRSSFVLPLVVAALTIASLLLLCPSSARAQGGVPLWTNRYNGPSNGDDYATAIALDRSGNVFVTGSSWNGSSVDYVTIKYSNTGVPLWTNHYDGGYWEEARAIAADSSGNVFVTGYSGNGSDGDYATIAYSNSGIPLWTNRYNGPGNGEDAAVGIAAADGGNVFVTGSSRGLGGSLDWLTIKYSSDGVPLWTNHYDGGYWDYARAIGVDSSDNVFVTGGSDGVGGVTIKYSNEGVPLWTNNFPFGGATDIAVDSNGNVVVTAYLAAANGNVDCGTIKYSGTGVLLWTNRYAGTGDSRDDYPEAIAVDSSGNVFVTGDSRGTNNLPPGNYSTIKYSGAGELLWTNRYNGPGNDTDFATAIALDSSGNVFVTGGSYGGASDFDYATIAYSNSGVPLWTNRYNGPGNDNDRAYAIAVDRTGNVFVTGFSGNGNHTDYADYVTIKYSSSVPPPRLDFQKLNNELVLSWTNAGFTLQTAPAVTGPFTNLPAATSPYTNPITAPQQFFRLIGN